MQPRTPYEERLHLFSTSEPISLPENSFGAIVARFLKSSLELHPGLKDIRVQFVKGGGLGVDLILTKKGLLQVHKKWASFDSVHQEAGCEFFKAGTNAQMLTDEACFFCEHVVDDLLELALDEIRGKRELDLGVCKILRRKARTRLRQMPRLIQVCATEIESELEVTWVGNESKIFAEKYGGSISYLVSLHKMSTCSTRKENLLSVGGRYLLSTRSFFLLTLLQTSSVLKKGM